MVTLIDKLTSHRCRTRRMAWFKRTGVSMIFLTIVVSGCGNATADYAPELRQKAEIMCAIPKGTIQIKRAAYLRKGSIGISCDFSKGTDRKFVVKATQCIKKFAQANDLQLADDRSCAGF